MECGKNMHLQTNMEEIAFSISYCDQTKRVYIKWFWNFFLVAANTSALLVLMKDLASLRKTMSYWLYLTISILDMDLNDDDDDASDQ